MAKRTKGQHPPDTWQEELDQLERWVREGRPDLVRQRLVDRQSDPYGTEERLAAMEQAMDAACQMGTEHLIDIAFQRMLRTDLWLQIRLECELEPKARAWGPGAGHEIERRQNDALPNIERLQRHICQVAKTYASIKHVLNLSEQPDDQAFKERVLKLVREAAEPPQDLGRQAGEARVG